LEVDAAGAAFGVLARIVFLRTVIDPLLMQADLPVAVRAADIAKTIPKHRDQPP